MKNTTKGLKVTENLAKEKVKMRFKQNMYFNDMNNPLYLAGEVYEIEGADKIQRWLKRGGEIVEGTFNVAPADAPNPSKVVGKKSEEVAVEPEKVEDSEKTEETTTEEVDDTDSDESDDKSHKSSSKKKHSRR